MKFIFIQPPTLENSRVLLKPLEEEDFEGLCEIGLEPSLWKISSNNIQTKDDLYHYLSVAIGQRNTLQAIPFTIIDKAAGRIAGCTRFGNISFENRRMEIGWTWLGVEFQKTGLNRACKYELLKYAFETVQVIRVELKADVLNLNSREAMRKIGATEEGILRRHMITESGRIRDTVYYSIIAEEWADVKKNYFTKYAADDK